MFELANKMVGIYKIKDITRTITIAPRKVTKYFQSMKSKIIEAQQNAKLAEEAKELCDQIAEQANARAIEEIKRDTDENHIHIESSEINIGSSSGILQNELTNGNNYDEVNKENIDTNYTFAEQKSAGIPLMENMQRNEINEIGLFDADIKRNTKSINKTNFHISESEQEIQKTN